MAQRLRDQEEEEDDDCLLVARERKNAGASKSVEPVKIDVAHSRVEEISKGSSNKVPELLYRKKAPCLGGHLEGEAERPSPEPLQNKDNASSVSFGVINVDDSPPGPEFSEGKIRGAQNMRSSEVEASHEGHDIFRECLVGLEDGPAPDASFIFDEAVVLHKKVFSKSRTDLARCEAELKKISKERDDLINLYVKKEVEISDLRFYQKADLVAQLQEELKMKKAETLGWRQSMDNLASEIETLRAELASLERQFQSVKEESLARGRDIEELRAKSAAELAKDRSDAEAIMSSYRADAEAANARAKEISSAAEVKLSSALDHARRQSRRTTLEEVHARGFDLSADIERAKILEEEAAALLSDEDDSANCSESGGDKGEVFEDEAFEDEAPEDEAAEDVTPK
ncbi:PREDICTED: uncharacterized protein LOC109232707 [Nicotiana attenuata]|uniref:uncharacterized protein LOC109232707 n=1 Tax=Nicotiana attenuata TaxID=49451 RepID=UPI0009054D77|nr:PREDICTED: uncharacterized protein LOC109232707 [Nicotiana attenuata]